jgi:hypothetical protein
MLAAVDATSWVAGIATVAAIGPLIPLWRAPLWRRLLTIALAFGAGQAFNASDRGDSRWAVALLSIALAALSVGNYITWRRAPTSLLR